MVLKRGAQETWSRDVKEKRVLVAHGFTMCKLNLLWLGEDVWWVELCLTYVDDFYLCFFTVLAL
jgi:hypothetical protein